MQLRVEKSDGSIEVYLHTKVMGSIARALAESEGFQEGLPEQLAEAVTTYLRRRYQGGEVSSDEIHSMIEVVLYDTSYGQAALALHEHRVKRQIRRRRTEVVSSLNGSELSEADEGNLSRQDGEARLWNKTEVVQILQENYGLDHNFARAVAGMVEEKVLGLGCRQITSSLVGELVSNEMLSLVQAEQSVNDAGAEEEIPDTLVADESTEGTVVSAESA